MEVEHNSNMKFRVIRNLLLMLFDSKDGALLGMSLGFSGKGRPWNQTGWYSSFSLRQEYSSGFKPCDGLGVSVLPHIRATNTALLTTLTRVFLHGGSMVQLTFFILGNFPFLSFSASL